MSTHAFPGSHARKRPARAPADTMMIPMTDWFIVLATALAGLLLADPFYGGWLARSIFAKVLAVGSVTVALSFHLLARKATAPEAFGVSSRAVFARWYPIVLLGVMIISGSVYAIKVEDVRNNFLNFGLSMLFLPALAIAIDSSSNPLGLLKWLAVVYVLTVLTILIEMPFTGSTHHEEVFVAIPLGLFFLSASKLNWWKVLLGFGLIGACAFSIKNTTFIMMAVAVMTAYGLWILRLTKVKDKLKAFVWSLCALLLVGLFMASSLVAWYKFKDRLPHGNTEYREEMYGIAWNKFKDSPVWGNLFTGETVSYFGLYKVDMPTPYLPTHSDILDILANGGLIGIVLWSMTVANVFYFIFVSMRHLSRPSPDKEIGWRWLLVLSIYQFCAMVTYAVNPPLINPLHGFWIWGGLAVTWALWRQLVPANASAAPARGRPRRA